MARLATRRPPGMTPVSPSVCDPDTGGRAVKMTDEVERRYLTDAVFHARVDGAVGIIEQDRDVRFDAHDRSLATLAAAVALHQARELWIGGG